MKTTSGHAERTSQNGVALCGGAVVKLRKVIWDVNLGSTNSIKNWKK